jgi:hypothetical protein
MCYSPLALHNCDIEKTTKWQEKEVQSEDSKPRNVSSLNLKRTYIYNKSSGNQKRESKR